MSIFHMLSVVCPLIFLASFVDSIAGGGGLISLPAYMLTGLPMHTVCGCNKLSACAGTAFSAARFYKGGKMHVKSAVIAGVFALIGAAGGASINMMIDSALLKKIFVVLLPIVAVLVLFGGKRATRPLLPDGKKLWMLSTAIGFFIGLYDGLIGPGTGTFIIFSYTTFAGFDHVTASGNAKVVNLASNLASLITYLFAGQVLFALAVPAAFFSILGGLLGSSMAMRHGSKLIKAIMVAVLIGIFAKLIWDAWGPK